MGTSVHCKFGDTFLQAVKIVFRHLLHSRRRISLFADRLYIQVVNRTFAWQVFRVLAIVFLIAVQFFFVKELDTFFQHIVDLIVLNIL